MTSTSDRTPQPCLHPRANHQHGQPVTYKRDRCRCAPCTTSYLRWQKERAHAHHNGHRAYTAPDRARAHVEQLLAAGVTIGQIEQRSGVHRTAIRILIGDWEGRPPSRSITPKTERALLAVTPVRFGDEQHGLVDPTGTRRRIQALVAVGWTITDIATAVGCLRSNFAPIAYGARPIRAATRQVIADLYDQWWDRTPPVTSMRQQQVRTRTVRMAAARGWPPPLAWDDETIDDPAASPSGMVIPIHDQRRKVDPAEVEFLLDSGSGRVEIEARLKISVATLQTVLTRHRPDLWDRIRDLEQARRTQPRKVA